MLLLFLRLEKASLLRVQLWYRYCSGLVLTALLFFILHADSSSLTPSPSPSPQPEPEPSFYLPMGSYLEHFNIGAIYFYGGNLFRKTSYGRKAVTFTQLENIPTAESCARQDFDLAKGNGDSLVCNTSVRRNHDNAARFFYSVIPSSGSYLKRCTGMLRTREGENNTKYLYASCSDDGIGRLIFSLGYKPEKFDLSGCESDIFYDGKRLTCSGSPRQQRHILSGSYLDFCSLLDTVYDPDTGMLTTTCRGRSQVLLQANHCIGNGKDIALRPTTKSSDKNASWLVCENNAGTNVTEHISSPSLPAGNYLGTCQDQVYYPCLGGSDNPGRGVLGARCAKTPDGDFQETRLTDRDGGCRMSGMGYVSNINGELKCDPGITFENEDATDGTDLQGNLQCPMQTAP